MSYSGWICSIIARRQGNVQSLAPDFQLINGSGSECITGGHSNRQSLRLQLMGQLGARGGFTGAIDTYHRDNCQIVPLIKQGVFTFLKRLFNFVFSNLNEIEITFTFGVIGFFCGYTSADNKATSNSSALSAVKRAERETIRLIS